MDALIGIDVGTSGCKVIALDTDGRRLGQGGAAYRINYPRQGWAEQQPQDWYEGACTATRECVKNARLRPKDVLGISVTGPAHNVALLGENGQILRPTLHWSDLRCETQCDRLQRDWGDRIFAITGQRMHPSWTLPQLLWVKENEPTVWKGLTRILVTKDYVRHRLTGDFVTDSYDAIGTMLCDLQSGKWSEEICEYLELPLRVLPEIRKASAVAGKLSEDAARATGLLAGTPVAVGSGDSVVEAFGAGAFHAGDCLIKLGSSANIDLVTSIPRPSPKTITYPYFVDGLGFTVAATISGASSWRWFRDHAFAAAQGGARFTDSELMTQAAGVPAGSEGLLFHPYLMGERVPYWDPSLRASFLGISARHSLGHFSRAVMEGVAFSLRDCLLAVEELGEPARSFKLLGGGSANALWRQIICDVLGHPITLPEVADASLGAALLAGHAVGLFPNWQAAARICQQPEETIQPDEQAHAAYSAVFEVYRQSVAPLQAITVQLRDCCYPMRVEPKRAGEKPGPSALADV